MKSVDRILESLRDSQWHSLDEIRAKFSLPEDKATEIIHFLEEQGFVGIDNERGGVKIKPLGLEFLALPSE